MSMEFIKIIMLFAMSYNYTTNSDSVFKQQFSAYHLLGLT